MNRCLLRSFVLVTAALLSGCYPYTVVRSAEVRPGASLYIQAGWSQDPESAVALDGCLHCDGPRASVPHPVYDLGLNVGIPLSKHIRALEFGLGFGMFRPYASLYAQLAQRETRSYGIGGRIGLIEEWDEYQLFARYDVHLSSQMRLLLNPSVSYQDQSDMNGDQYFYALNPGVGVELQGRNLSFAPTLTFVTGRGQWIDYSAMPETGPVARPFNATFGIVSMALTWHRAERLPVR